MRTANPALNDNVFRVGRTRAEPMTIMGTVHKTALLLAIAVIAATFAWAQHFSGGPVAPLAAIGFLGGLVVAIVTVIKPSLVPYTAPLYAALEGLGLGAVSALYEAQYAGLPLQAASLTFLTLGALLLAYRSGLIHASDNFRLGVVAATGGIALFYLVSLLLGFFGITMPLLHDNGPFGIVLSLVIVVVAALNLVLDFDFIENGAARGAPKYMEWYGAFGLMVTLVWLYLELLRLLAKLRSRD